MIDCLTLQNFKAFPFLELPLAPLSLLTGLNSSGKSSVLQSIALLRQSYEAGVLEASRYLPEARRAGLPRGMADQGFLLNGELVGLGIGKDVLHEDDTLPDDVPISLAVDEGPYHYGWVVGYEAEQNLLPLITMELPSDLEGLPPRPGPKPSPPRSSPPPSSTCTPTAFHPPSSIRATITRLSAGSSWGYAASTPSTICATTRTPRFPPGRCTIRVPRPTLCAIRSRPGWAICAQG